MVTVPPIEGIEAWSPQESGLKAIERRRTTVGREIEAERTESEEERGVEGVLLHPRGDHGTGLLEEGGEALRRTETRRKEKRTSEGRQVKIDTTGLLALQV